MTRVREHEGAKLCMYVSSIYLGTRIALTRLLKFNLLGPDS